MKFISVLVILSFCLSVSGISQQFKSDNPGISAAFQLAVQTVDINTRRGILAAGGDYGGEWTRDISINSWNGVSLLRPGIAENSLWSVTIHEDSIGHQYWDKIIWVLAAFNQYQITGDKEFLAQAYHCASNTLKALEAEKFDGKYGLFKGPSVFNDGIAAYPEPIYEPANYSSSVLDHKGSENIKCLSTNCIYFGAYKALYQMSIILDENKSETVDFLEKSVHLKNNILKNLYNKESNTFYYLIDQLGNIDKSQEALGISYAVLFGIVDSAKANQLIAHTKVSKFGITSIYPDFPRYSADKPGRHNNMVWPMVNGFFAHAAIVSGNYATFTSELVNLTNLALDEDKGDYNFREIYNANTGKPDGGWQANGAGNPDFHWASCKLQTWSATAYISMILYGLFGMEFSATAVSFKPYLPSGTGSIEFRDLKYRDAILNISIIGKGNVIKLFSVDGKLQKNHFLNSNIKGVHSVSIQMG